MRAALNGDDLACKPRPTTEARQAQPAKPSHLVGRGPARQNTERSDPEPGGLHNLGQLGAFEAVTGGAARSQPHSDAQARDASGSLPAHPPSAPSGRAGRPFACLPSRRHCELWIQRPGWTRPGRSEGAARGWHDVTVRSMGVPESRRDHEAPVACAEERSTVMYFCARLATRHRSPGSWRRPSHANKCQAGWTKHPLRGRHRVHLKLPYVPLEGKKHKLYITLTHVLLLTYHASCSVNT